MAHQKCKMQQIKQKSRRLLTALIRQSSGDQVKQGKGKMYVEGNEVKLKVQDLTLQ